jgi:hypothetical protein
MEEAIDPNSGLPKTSKKHTHTEYAFRKYFQDTFKAQFDLMTYRADNDDFHRSMSADVRAYQATCHQRCDDRPWKLFLNSSLACHINRS